MSGRPGRTMTSVRSPGRTPAGRQPRAPRVDLGVQFRKGEREVIDVTGAGPAAGDLHRRVAGLARGHERQVARDVGGVGGHGFQARANPTVAQG